MCSNIVYKPYHSNPLIRVKGQVDEKLQRRARQTIGRHCHTAFPVFPLFMGVMTTATSSCSSTAITAAMAPSAASRGGYELRQRVGHFELVHALHVFFDPAELREKVHQYLRAVGQKSIREQPQQIQMSGERIR